MSSREAKVLTVLTVIAARHLKADDLLGETRKLIPSQYSPNAQTRKGQSALGVAATAGALETVRYLLLECRADPYLSDGEGKELLDHAVPWQRDQIAELVELYDEQLHDAEELPVQDESLEAPTNECDEEDDDNFFMIVEAPVRKRLPIAEIERRKAAEAVVARKHKVRARRDVETIVLNLQDELESEDNGHRVADYGGIHAAVPTDVGATQIVETGDASVSETESEHTSIKGSKPDAACYLNVSDEKRSASRVVWGEPSLELSALSAKEQRFVKTAILLLQRDEISLTDLEMILVVGFDEDWGERLFSFIVSTTASALVSREAV